MSFVGRSFLEIKIKGDLVEGGNKNTDFFHKMTNAHRRRNSLVRIKTNGNWVSMESKIKVGMVHIFQSLLAENGDWRPSCLGLTFDALGEYHADLLEVPFFEVEVFKTLFNLKGIKALGPYGFSLVFW